MEGGDGIKLFFAGDLMTGRGIDQMLPCPSAPELYEAYVRDARQYLALAERVAGPLSCPAALDYMWGVALDALAREAPDFRIANLETAITCSDDYWPGKGIHYRMHPGNAGCLDSLALDFCALANNHVLDWGYAGLAETLQILKDVGVAVSGAGANLEQAAAPAVMKLPARAAGGRLLVFSFGLPSSGIPEEWAATKEKAGVFRLPDLSQASVASAVEHIQQHRREADLTVASVHWGPNWGYIIRPEQRAFARALVDAGVDLLHGHSSHHPIGMELYRERLICYGCGDFVNDYEGIRGYEAFRPHLSLLYLLTLKRSGEMEGLKIIPMQMRGLRLRHAEPDDVEWMGKVLARESGDFGVELRTESANREAFYLASCPGRE